MFAFSPVWGAFLDRRGRKRGLLTAGSLLFLGAGFTGIASHPILSGLGLFLVGLGWSGLYLGVTAVVSDFTAASERGGALGFTDFASATSSSVGALVAGILLDGPGFGAVGLVMMAVLLPTIATVGLVGASRWRPIALKPA
jgi:MFS family permease